MLSFKVITADAEIEETATKLDIFAYEDERGRSFISAYDAKGVILAGELYRLAWTVLRRRHAETRSFIAWMEEADPLVQLGARADPTGETPTLPAEESPVSPSAPDSTLEPSST